MILSKAGKLSLLAGLLCLLLMGFAGASYGAVRFDVVPSPTEVINTGRAEVLGGVNMVVFSTGLTGTATGGWAQIGIIFSNGVQIDNNVNGGIKLAYSSGFNGGTGFQPYILPAPQGVQNLSITGRCSGFVTINIPPGLTVAANDFIRLEGVRGRIDLSDGAVAGTDLYAQLQSINDPAANTFFPETVRVAKSLPGLRVDVTDANVLLCFPPLGVVPGANAPNYYITVTEGFVRAFVSNDGNIQNRTDSGNPIIGVLPALLGAPTNSTQIRVVLNSIPASISSVTWPATSSIFGTVPNQSWLELTGSQSFSGGVAEATYLFRTQSQTGMSDINLETYTLSPQLNVSATNQTDTGTVLAAAALYPFAGTAGGCDAPLTSNFSQPKFATLYQSSNNVTSTSKTSTTFDLYATIIRCNCFLLYTYVTKDAFWNTGMVVANTTGDAEVFGTAGAPKQLGPITFYFYDKTAGYVGATTTTSTYGPGTSFVGLLSQILPSTVTSFSGYVIAKAQFQFCHGYAFIADSTFANIAQGYLANVIPDPAIKGGTRQPSAAADVYGSNFRGIPAGESINN
jgi:hypothetical protein